VENICREHQRYSRQDIRIQRAQSQPDGYLSSSRLRTVKTDQRTGNDSFNVSGRLHLQDYHRNDSHDERIVHHKRNFVNRQYQHVDKNMKDEHMPYRTDRQRYDLFKDNDRKHKSHAEQSTDIRHDNGSFRHDNKIIHRSSLSKPYRGRRTHEEYYACQHS
jgi:hypothetical protein